ncbi:MAG TPA: T9SS type A sorting domain-containing protein [Bacteroidales bacterium]|nr:T9SS type A sorting domain-containing protein [Bacteroidales bacterium]HNS46447.1 T9SS type A sorting domain-containing protein [Bacteroidales bacterium]
MKKAFTLLVCLTLLLPGMFAQENSIGKVRVSKATYYDKTPPLRSMPVVLPGERIRSWKNNIIKNPSLERTFTDEQKAHFETVTDPVAQQRMGERNQRGPILNFKGVGNVNSVYPPDTDGDVGPNHYFQMINLSFAIWDKNGNKLYGPVDNATLWFGFAGPWTGTNDGDPIVVYDHLADRWVASQFAIHTDDGSYWELVAVSATGDPLGEYYRYAFEFPAFNDYPKLGVWHDGYYATFNMFGGNTRGAVSSFEREKMLAGDPDAQMVYFDMWGTFSLLPADVDGPSPPANSPNYIIHRRVWDDQHLEVYAMQVDWDNPDNSSIELIADLATEPYNASLDGIPQPGTGVRLDDLAVMLMYRLQYRNFTDYEVLLTNHTVKVNGNAAVRWYELRKEQGPWYVYQQGTYAPDDENRWMGSIAMNGAGEIALGYTVSSSATYPSVRFTGRSADAPAGVMNYAERELIAGQAPQTALDRWGDYSCMTVDPVDDYTFWYTQEYSMGNWSTRIGSFDFGPVQPPQIAAAKDTVICEDTPFTAVSTGIYVQSVLWSTDGDGFFVPAPPVNMEQGYIRGPLDIANGGFTLAVTAFGYEPGLQDQDTMYVALARWPSVFAGNDTTICYNTSVLLEGEVSSASEVLWSTPGDGSFDDPSILQATYTPGASDLANGSVRLTLTGYPIDPCEEPKSDKVRVKFDPCTGISEPANPDVQVKIVPNPATDSFRVTITGLKDQPYDISLLNQAGERIFTKKGASGSGPVDEQFIMNYQPRGIYFIEIRSGKVIRTEKVIVQ